MLLVCFFSKHPIIKYLSVIESAINIHTPYTLMHEPPLGMAILTIGTFKSFIFLFLNKVDFLVAFLQKSAVGSLVVRFKLFLFYDYVT